MHENPDSMVFRSIMAQAVESTPAHGYADTFSLTEFLQTLAG
jgi:hypothetical protein